MTETRSSILSSARKLASGALLLQLTACGPSFNFVYMAKDSNGDEKTTKFLAVGDEMHCVMEMVGGDEDTVVTLDLAGPGDIRLPDGEFFPRPQGKQGPIFLDVQLFTFDAQGNRSDTGPWPVGSYTIDVYLDDSVEETLPFEVVQ